MKWNLNDQPHGINGSGDSMKIEQRRSCTKASDVQHTNEVSRRVKGEALVDPGDHMIKETAVDGFSQSVTCTGGLLHLQRNPAEDNKSTITPLKPTVSFTLGIVTTQGKALSVAIISG